MEWETPWELLMTLRVLLAYKRNWKELHLLRQQPAHQGFNSEHTDFKFKVLPAACFVYALSHSYVLLWLAHISPADLKLQGEGTDHIPVLQRKSNLDLPSWRAARSAECPVVFLTLEELSRLMSKHQSTLNVTSKPRSAYSVLSLGNKFVVDQHTLILTSVMAASAMNAWKCLRLFSLLPPLHIPSSPLTWGFL